MLLMSSYENSAFINHTKQRCKRDQCLRHVASMDSFIRHLIFGCKCKYALNRVAFARCWVPKYHFLLMEYCYIWGTSNHQLGPFRENRSAYILNRVQCVDMQNIIHRSNALDLIILIPSQEYGLNGKRAKTTFKNNPFFIIHFYSGQSPIWIEQRESEVRRAGADG